MRVELRTAVRLTDAEQRRITQRMGSVMHVKVRARARVDPWLLGGLMIRLDDTVLDGTARGRLETLRQALQARAF